MLQGSKLFTFIIAYLCRLKTQLRFYIIWIVDGFTMYLNVFIAPYMYTRAQILEVLSKISVLKSTEGVFFGNIGLSFIL